LSSAHWILSPRDGLPVRAARIDLPGRIRWAGGFHVFAPEGSLRLFEGPQPLEAIRALGELMGLKVIEERRRNRRLARRSGESDRILERLAEP